MISTLKRNIILNLKNIPGWKTDRKIVVFESDDWGSLRMPSAAHLKRLVASGIVSEKNTYDTLDSPESGTDLQYLFEVLHSVKDSNGKPAVFTPFMNLVNPDFKKIEEAGFKEYFYEDFTQTLARYGLHDTMPMYHQGIKEGIFLPEYHGREHLNVAAWMDELRCRNEKVMEGFRNEFTSVNLNSSDQLLGGFRQTYFYRNLNEVASLEQSVAEGAAIFAKIFGYKTTVFDAPNAIFHPSMERALYKVGIKNIVLQRFRTEPDGNGGAKNSFYQFGQKNQFGQVYHIRNCMYEPRTGVDENVCLPMIRAAFRWGKPAIITTHRVNFMGGIDVKNRDKNLKSLATLLKSILKQWPDAEFMSSAQFAQIMHK